MKSKLNYFQIFKDVTTIISFVTGIITLISTIIALQIPNISLTYVMTNIKIKETHLFSFWVIMIFTYIVILHSYWERNKRKLKLDENFVDYLYSIFTTPRPLFMLPFVILILILFFIIDSFLATLIFIVGTITLLVHYNNGFSKVKRYKKSKWSEIKKRLEIELFRYQWFDTSALRDIAYIWGVEHYHLRSLLADYAREEPTKALYRSVYDKETNDNIAEDVLISLELFDYDKYYYN